MTAPAVVDVVIATRNRPQDMERMLPTLRAQTEGRFRAVVLDQSDDTSATATLIAALGDERFVHMRDDQRGKSRALNVGLQQTAAPFVAFTDDDCELPDGWLAKGLENLRRTDVTGVAFGDVVPAAHDPDHEFVPAIHFDGELAITSVAHGLPPLIGMGANMFVRRAVFREVGLFDVDLGPGGRLHTGEECELAYRALRNGWAVHQDPALQVLHWGARPLAGNIARDLVNTGFFAIAAGLGKHARSGDGRAVTTFGRELVRVAATTGRALSARTGPYHVRRFASTVHGFGAGLRAGPAWPALVA